jgi:hypothetical protein
VGAGISSNSCGTSSPGRTVTAEPYGTGTSSSSGGTIAVSGCDSETSSSKKRMCFALGTSSSSHIMCIANWSGETNSSKRRQLDSPDRPWLGFRIGAGGRWVGTNESTVSVWLGRCPYLFAQGTSSNGQMSR